jgi:hypothetical protein
MFQTEVVEQIKNTHFMSNYFLENRAVYEMWKNVSEPDRPRMKKWRMRIACWMIPKTKDTHSEYVNTYSFSTKMVSERASVLRYTYIACFVKTFFVLKYCIKRGDHVRENILPLMPINVIIAQHSIIFLFSEYNVVLADCNIQPYYLITQPEVPP